MKKLIFLNIVLLIVSIIVNVSETNALTVDQKVETLLSKAEYLSKKKGGHAFALKLCHEAIKLQPGNLDTYYRRAFIYGRKGDYANAIKDFSIIIKYDEKAERRKYPSARKFRADCFMGLGYMQNAVDDYWVMLKRNPTSRKSGKIWNYLAEALALMNKTQEALEAIQRGCATGSHWCEKMKILQKKILTGQKIQPHRPLSN